MKSLIAAIMMFLLVVVVVVAGAWIYYAKDNEQQAEPESRYRIEYNEITKSYRVAEYQNGKWDVAAHGGTTLSDENLTKEEALRSLAKFREEAAEDRRRILSIKELRNAWRVVE